MPPIRRPLIHPRDEIVQTIERIYHYRMTTTSGGNLSIRDENGDIWITPARIDKGNLRPEDIVRVCQDGSIDGRHKPSSEHPFHQSIFRARPDLRAVVHAHPVALVAFSVCRKSPDTTLYPQAEFVCGPVGFAPYALPGSDALGSHIAKVFAEGFNSVMLENHGVVVGGSDLQDAFGRFETLEFTGKTIIKATQLGTVRYLTPAQVQLARRPRAIMEEFEPASATTREKEVRKQLCDFIRRGYRQRLLTSTGGSFSARVDANAFVISSYNVDRSSVDPSQLTLIENGRRETGKQPSRAVRIHEAIYRAYPGIAAVVNATPVNATAFSVSSTPLDSRTIPESFLFLRDVGMVPFDDQFGDGARVRGIVNPKRPVALMEHNGALVLGTSVLDAFDRLEVLESTAEAIINARALGTICPMNPTQINELIAAFDPQKP